MCAWLKALILSPLCLCDAISKIILILRIHFLKFFSPRFLSFIGDWDLLGCSLKWFQTEGFHDLFPPEAQVVPWVSPPNSHFFMGRMGMNICKNKPAGNHRFVSQIWGCLWNVSKQNLTSAQMQLKAPTRRSFMSWCYESFCHLHMPGRFFKPSMWDLTLCGFVMPCDPRAVCPVGIPIGIAGGFFYQAEPVGSHQEQVLGVSICKFEA